MVDPPNYPPQFDRGHAPPEAKAALLRLHASRPLAEEVTADLPETLSAPDALVFESIARWPEWVPELAARVEKPQVPVTIRINGVSIHLTAIDASRDGNRFCLLVADEVHCELPYSRDVWLTVKGETHQVFYVGQWFSFPILPFRVVCFCALETQEATDTA